MALAGEFGLAGRNHYAHPHNPPYWGAVDGAIDALWLRRTVGRKLANVNARLAPAGLALFLFDAWRPDAVQIYFHDVWMPRRVRERRPDLDQDAVVAEVERYWSAPTIDPAAPAPHRTGGAVDLTIVDARGAHLFMGSVFDDPSPVSHTDAFEGVADESFSAEEARANRRMLYWLMTEQGFANHPDEWWHFSYGDRIWAALTGAPAAFYGAAEPME
jgi:zinc D-Ala-D-Ala dipeptidase